MKPEQLAQLLQIKNGRRLLTIGMPATKSQSGGLTPITPEGVAILIAQGFEIIIEKGLGDPIRYEDNRYAATGAHIASRAETLKCDIILYAEALLPEEVAIMKRHAVLLTLLHNRLQNLEAVRTLLTKSITVVALDEVRDCEGNQSITDILDEIAGRAAMVSASTFLGCAAGGKGILPGGVAGINPCEVVIMGTGMAAIAAGRSAIGLGAIVRLFDSNSYSLRSAVDTLGPAVIASAIHPTVLGHALASADVVIATKHSRHVSIADDIVDDMKNGVIIFDLDDRYGLSPTFPTLRCMDTAMAVDRGITPSNKLCLINTSHIVPRTVAMAMTNDIVDIVDRMFGQGRGLMNVLKTDTGIRTGVIFFRGRVVNPDVADNLHVKCVDINLLLSFS